MLELWIFAPLTLAVIGSGVIVVIAIDLVPFENASAPTRGLATAVAGGLSGFISASLVTWTADRDGSRVSSRIRDAFFARYIRPRDGFAHPARATTVIADSDFEKWIYSTEFGGVTGWGVSARWKRASQIATFLPR
jgi:hypothetical protein